MISSTDKPAKPISPSARRMRLKSTVPRPTRSWRQSVPRFHLAASPLARRRTRASTAAR